MSNAPFTCARRVLMGCAAALMVPFVCGGLALLVPMELDRQPRRPMVL